LLVADELLLGRGQAVDDPVRSDSSPIAVRLAHRLGGNAFWDGRAGMWAAPEVVDTGPGLHAIIFNTQQNLTPDQVREGVSAALREIRGNAMSDAEIVSAREALARFYQRWFFEPTYRIFSDHLMGYLATGRDPELVKRIPDQIRRVQPEAVRSAVDRYLLRVEPLVVILPRGAP
jgi:hypothetical protein